jgi:uncharacterized protein
MNEQLKALNALQQVDLGIAAANRAVAALDNGDLVRAHLGVAEKKLAVASESLRKSEAELRDKELSLKSLETKLQNFQEKLYKGQVTNPKELSSIEKEIEMLGKTRSQLDERILELYEIVEREQGEKRQIEEVATKLRGRLDRTVTEYQAKSTELRAELDKLGKERQAVLPQVTDKQLLSRYETLRGRYKDTGLATMVDGKCGGCHVTLTPFTLRKLQDDKELMTCESCGRILSL